VQNKPSLRLLDSSDPNEIRKLTDFLNIIYKDRADKGIDYLPSSQDEDTTRLRIKDKECWVAEIGEQIVGTFTISAPENTRGCWWYRQSGVAEASQLAVHPNFRSLGMFLLLTGATEQRALELGALEVAGSAPSQRKRLIAAYIRRGHRIVDYKWSKNASYGCVIFSKALQVNGIRSKLHRRILRKMKYYRRFIKYNLQRWRVASR